MQAAAQRTNYADYNDLANDYAKIPAKPTWESEALYEDTVWNFPTCTGARATGWDTRKYAYWTVFAGGFGASYGHNSIYAFFRPGDTSESNCQRYNWYDVLNSEGRLDMQHVRTLIESRPYFTRIPDQSVITSAQGSGDTRVQATRSSDGSYAMVYISNGASVTVNMSKIAGTVTAWWYNPRDGSATQIGQFANSGTRTFTPSTSGAGNDWVLVLDQASRNFAAPGQ
jgi:hypothetical protein